MKQVTQECVMLHTGKHFLLRNNQRNLEEKNNTSWLSWNGGMCMCRGMVDMCVMEWRNMCCRMVGYGRRRNAPLRNNRCTIPLQVHYSIV